MKIESRADKVALLKRLQQEKASVHEIVPFRIESWKHYKDQPEIYINCDTGEQITVSEMEEKQRPKNTIFEIRTYEGEP